MPIPINPCANPDSAVDWFRGFGSYDASLRILARLGDTTSIATQFWTACFTDPISEAAFVLLWGGAQRVDGHWVAPDVIALEWLRECPDAEVAEAVELTFFYPENRLAFIAACDP